MYANHNELPALLVQIPRKEILCGLRTLDATLLADNCSTACSTQSKMSEMIIEIARRKGITNKNLLVHHFGHCQNHMQNRWCNVATIVFGKRSGNALLYSLPCFAPHLRISGELDNIHR